MFVISANVKIENGVKEMYLAYNEADQLYWTESYLNVEVKKFETMFEAAKFLSDYSFKRTYVTYDTPILKQITTVTIGPM